MKKSKFLIPFLAITFSIATVKGQDNLIINLADDNSVTIAIDNIERITFNADSIFLKKSNGTKNSYFLDDITSITFLDDEPTTIKDMTKNIELNVYVNASGEIIVESPAEIRKLTVFDLNGREVATTTHSKLNANSLSTGMYLLNVETVQGVVTKKFIKN